MSAPLNGWETVGDRAISRFVDEETFSFRMKVRIKKAGKADAHVMGLRFGVQRFGDKWAVTVWDPETAAVLVNAVRNTQRRAWQAANRQLQVMGVSGFEATSADNEEDEEDGLAA